VSHPEIPDFDPWDPDAPVPDFPEIPADVWDPVSLEPPHDGWLPGGDAVLIYGDVDGWAEYIHAQGDNPRGLTETSGLVAAEQVLRRCGIEVTEADLLQLAAGRGLCDLASGSVSPLDLAVLLEECGARAHFRVAETVDDLALRVQLGQGVIVLVNAGVLWGEADHWGDGGANHAVVVTGVARDPETKELLGFFINDSGSNEAGKFIDLQTMQAAWQDAPAGGGYGTCVVVPELPPRRD
jgi:hypothetical protein